jgi:catalase
VHAKGAGAHGEFGKKLKKKKKEKEGKKKMRRRGKESLCIIGITNSYF